MSEWMSRLGLVALIVLCGGCSEGIERVVDSYTEDIDANDVVLLGVTMGEGDLSISGAATGKITASVELVTDRESEEDDLTAIMEYVVQLREMDVDEALLKVVDPDLDGYWVNIELTVPDALELSIADPGGSVLIDNCGPVELQDGAGDIELSGIRGDVMIEDGDGDMLISSVVGNVVIYDGAGDITVENVDGDLDIHDSGGEVATSGVTGDTNFHED